VARRQGATLIELLVVMAMIGLLISALIPSLKQSMDVAAATICKHNLRELGHCLELYRMDNDGWLPPAVRRSHEIESLGQRDPWFFKLYPTYLSDPMMLTCPEDPFRYRMAQATSRLRDPCVAEYASYGINSFIAASGGGFLANDRRQPARPHDTILMADLGPDVTGDVSQAADVIGPVRNASLLSWDDGFNPFTGRSLSPWLTQRHHGCINVLTLTGGVCQAHTKDMMHTEMQRYYEHCAVGGCTFCNELRLSHYSFARDHLYWWTGATPSE